VKNSSLCDLPQEVDDEYKGKLNLTQIKQKQKKMRKREITAVA